jgi:hypothetical protein
VHLLAYKASDGRGGLCGVSLWDVPGVVLLVLSDLPNNFGPSLVDNVQRVARRAVELTELDPRHTVVMVHDARANTFGLVRLDGHPLRGGDRLELSPMTPERWRDLAAASGGMVWGDGPPNVRVPQDLLPERFDGVPVDQMEEWHANIDASERALRGDADDENQPPASSPTMDR